MKQKYCWLHEIKAAQIFTAEIDAEDKLDAVISYLTQAHLESDGGYPYDFDIHDGKVWIAALDPGKENNATRLLVHDVTDLLDWFDRAKKCYEESPDFDFDVCLMEAEPE